MLTNHQGRNCEMNSSLKSSVMSIIFEYYLTVDANTTLYFLGTTASWLGIINNFPACRSVHQLCEIGGLTCQLGIVLWVHIKV